MAAVLDLGEEGDALYIVMEWVEGEPLQVVLREVARTGAHRVPLPLALRIVKQAASGLHAAHDLCDEGGKPVGLVHRDVSPANILVGYDGAVKVIDFGVAKAASNMQRTRVGQIKGKVAYMAPEQAMGEPVDRRTDVFALGLVLYQLVTGKHPFRGESEFATLARIRDNTVAASPRVYVPDLPPALEAVMLKALSKPRDGRFASMLELGRALEKALPAPSDIDRALGTFMSSLLSQRASRREQAIRDALQAVGERKGAHARPVNLGNKPIFEDPERSSGIRLLDDLVGPDPLAAERPSVPGPAAVTAPAVAARPLTVTDLGPVILPEGMRSPRSQVTKIVAAIAVVLVLVLVVWAVVGGSSGSGDTTPTRHAF